MRYAARTTVVPVTPLIYSQYVEARCPAKRMLREARERLGITSFRFGWEA